MSTNQICFIDIFLYIYQTVLLTEENKNIPHSIDESLFIHTKSGKKVWVLGIVNNLNKDFRLETTIKRDALELEKFIKNLLVKVTN